MEFGAQRRDLARARITIGRRRAPGGGGHRIATRISSTEQPGARRVNALSSGDGPGTLPRRDPVLHAHSKEHGMQLGAFSISLAVKNIHDSKRFYEKFGFQQFGGNIEQNWVILKNGDHIIGLFQGMFEKNILTFNPGWDQNAQKLPSFTDVREIQKQLKAAGIEFMSQADETTSGPASFIAVDPDGNPVLVDQHV
jgi:catechol 2,3-dioxygenase-like lactoylglutathione lyase family enzyme